MAKKCDECGAELKGKCDNCGKVLGNYAYCAEMTDPDDGSGFNCHYCCRTCYCEDVGLKKACLFEKGD